MCEIKDNLLRKIYKQIEEKKEHFGNPTINMYDDGTAILNFFDTWDDSIFATKKLLVKKSGGKLDGKKIQMVYSKKGTYVSPHDFDIKKRYVVLKGEINFLFDDEENILLNDLTSLIVPKNKIHGSDTLENTYLLVIEDELPISY